MRSSRVLALDCGAAHVACALFEVGAGVRPRLMQFATEPLAGNPEDEIQWSEALTRALTTMLQREKFPVRECVLGVPGHLALTKFVRTPAVARDKRERILQFEAAQNIPHPLDEVVWGHVEVSDDGADLDLMLAAVKRDAMEALCAAVEAAGLVVVGAEPGSLALWRAYLHGAADPMDPVMVVDVGARSTHLIFAGGTSFFTRTLSLGGNSVTHALAEDLRLDFPAAEELKVQVWSSKAEIEVDAISRTAVSRASEGFINRLELEITRSRLGYSRQPGATLPKRIWLTGAGSRVPGMREKLAAKLGLPVGYLTPLDRIDLTERSKLDGAAAAEDSLTVLLGLVMNVGTRNARSLQLLPSSRHASQVWRRTQPWWLAVAALLVGALLPPLAYYQIRTARLKNDLAHYERELAPLRRQAASNTSNLNKLDLLRRQTEAILPVANGRANWVAFMGDLQQRLGQVGDVWLERLEVVHETRSKRDAEATPSPRRLALGGRLLDTKNPLAKASDECYAKVKSLIDSLGKAPFVQTVANERFDNTQPGILRFEVTLVLDPDKPL